MKSFLLLLVFVWLSLSTITNAQPLTGTKTVGGSSPDYATLSLAIDALNSNGAGTGGVVFLVTAGHAETMVNKTITTTTGSAASPIIFMKSGSGANPLITAGAGSSTTTDAVIKIVGTDYLTFDGIDLVDPATNTTNSTRMEWGYAILKASATNACQNIVVKNCTVTLQKANTASKGIYGGNHIATSTTQLTITATTGIHRNIEIFNNTVTNSYSGIYFSGPANATYYDDSIRIGSSGGNVVTNFGGTSTACYGIYLANFIRAEIMNDSINGGASSTNDVAGIYTGTANGADLLIQNNYVQTQSNSSISNIYGIYSASGANGGNLNIRFNRIQNGVMSGSITQFYYIYTTTNANTNINDNLISGGAITTSQGSGYGIYLAGTPMVRNVFNNTISANSFSVSIGTNYGIYLAAGNAEIYNNTLNSNTCNNHYYAVYSTGSANIYRNTIQLNTVTGSSAQHYGIFCTGTLPHLVYENTVGPYSSTGSGVLQGIILAGTAEYRVYRNKVFGLSSSNTSAVVSGIVQSAASTAHIYNNLVGLLTTGASASAANGINAINITSTADGTVSNISYNNLFLNATSTGGSNCLLLSTAALATVTNNVMVNLSSNGTTTARAACAMKRTAAVFNTYLPASNNNFFFVGANPVANRFVFFDGTASFQTLAQYQTFANNRDQSSVSASLAFQSIAGASLNFLKPDTTLPCPLESSAKPITSITGDWQNNNSRVSYPLFGQLNGGGTGPDIGAYELDMIPVDSTGPEILFTPINRSLVVAYKNQDEVTITDPRGVNMSSGHVPRLYFKKSANSNALASSNSASSDGWKYVESFSSASPYSFIIDFSLLYPSGSIAAGDVIQYFVVAEDNSFNHNARVKGATLNTPAASVALVSNNFPATIGLSFPVVASGFPSTVTVGSGTANYSSFTLPGGLFDAINNSILTSDVIVQVTSDINGETGAVALNKFTEDGFGAGTFRIYIQPSLPQNFTITGSNTTAGLIRLADVARVSFDGRYAGAGNYLTFVNKAKSGNNAVMHLASSGFGGGCRQVTIRNCNLWSDSATATGNNGIFVGGTTIGSGGLSNNNAGIDHYGISLIGNSISGVYNGILLNGHSANPIDSSVIANNEIGSDTLLKYPGNCGISLLKSTRTQVTGNRIYNLISGGSNALYGIFAGTEVRNTEISANKITDLVNNSGNSVAVHGIYLSGTSNSNTRIMNNTITKVVGGGAATAIASGPTGIYIAGGSDYRVLNNSVSLSGTRPNVTAGNAYTACFYAGASVSGLTVMNNVFKNVMNSANTTGVGSNFALFSDAPLTAYQRLNHNLYFAASATTGMTNALAWQGSARADLATWRSYSGLDQNSLWGNPGYLSDSMVVLNLNDTSNWLLNGRGFPLAEVTSDMNGNARSTSVVAGASDVGAFEFTPAVPPRPATASAAPSAGSTSYYMVGADTVAAILWDATAIVPSTLELRYYSGTNPSSAPTNSHFNHYIDVQAFPNTGLNYSFRMYYKPESMRNLSNELNLVLAKRDPPAAWVPFSANTTVDTARNTMTVSLLGSFSQFTGTDLMNPLPLTLQSISAAVSGQHPEILWTTLTEKALAYFEVEERLGVEWVFIGKVKAIGNSNISRAYRFLHPEPIKAADQWFRLKMVDVDGSFTYSRAVCLKNELKEVFVAYPNPATSVVQLPFNTRRAVVYDMLGNSTQLDVKDHQTDVSVLAPGCYLLIIQTDNQTQTTKLMVGN